MSILRTLGFFNAFRDDQFMVPAGNCRLSVRSLFIGNRRPKEDGMKGLINVSRLKIFAATIILGSLGFAAPAQAGNTCKNVQLSVYNKTGETINLVDVDYWDPAFGSNGGWRSEPVKNITLVNDAVWRETRNLEKVNQRSTRLRIEWRKKGKLGGWSLKKYKTISGYKTCSERMEFSITVTK